MIDKAQAQLEVKITSNIAAATEGIHEYEATFGRLPDAIKRHAKEIEGSLTGIGKASREAGKAAGDGAKAGIKSWQDYTEALKRADEAHKQFRQGQVTSLGGGENVAGLSDSAKRDILKTYDAQSSSGMSVLLQERAAVEALHQFKVKTIGDNYNAEQAAAAAQVTLGTKMSADLIAQNEKRFQAEVKAEEAAYAAKKAASDKALALRATEDRTYNEYLSHQTAARKAATDSALAQIRREADAYTAAYTAQSNTATTGAATAAAAQRARRYAGTTVNSFGGVTDATSARNTAARNTADPYAREAAQAEYAAQGTRQFTESLRANAEAHNAATAAANANTGSIISARYALYDVATTYGIVGAAALSVSTLSVGAAASFESSFTSVQRTSDGSAAALAGIHDELVNLTTQIPLSFAEISKIATLGNQLGVSAGDITGFTETIAKFSTVTGMTAEATAQAFGRISNILGIPITEIDQLASGIALVGRTTAATEPEIISLVERLGATASRAGFTADQVVGLAASLGSLGVAPERAQGVFEKYFTTLNHAVAEGGDSLRNFSVITGLTGDSIDDLVRKGQGFEVFQKFLAGMQGADTVQLTGALDALGLSGLRSEEVLGRITGKLPLLKQAFDVAAQGTYQNTELDRQYAMVLDDLSTQFTLLGNALAALAASGGGDLIPGLAAAIGELTQLVNGARAFTETDLGGNIARMAIALSVVAGLFLTYRAGMALATASTYALVTAQTQLGASGTIGGIRGLWSAVMSYRGAAQGAAAATGTLNGAVAATGTAATVGARGVLVLRGAILALGRATIVIGVLQLLMEVLSDPQRSIGNAALGLAVVNDALLHMAFAAGDAGASLAHFVYQIGNLAANAVSTIPVIGFLGDAIRNITDFAVDGSNNVGGGFDDWGNKARATSVDLRNFAADAFKNADASDAAAEAAAGAGAATFDAGKAFEGMGNGADIAAGDLGGMGDAADEVAQEVRTLVDYAGDLSGVFKRAFDIRFGADQGTDKITSGWRAIAKATEASNKAIRDYKATLRDLNADQNTLKYQLKVAEAYGDTLKASELRGKIADNNNKIADTTKDLSKEQENNSKTLVGNSDAAIANRAGILGLVSSYQEQIATLAANGASQDTLKRKSAELKAEFIRQATQAGYSRDAVAKYARAFDDMSTAIARIPRNITVDVDPNPALQALAEFEAKAKSAARNAANSIRTGGGRGYGIPKIGGLGQRITVPVGYQLPSYDELMAMQAEIRRTTGDKHFRVAVGNGGQGGQVFGYAHGGYTGNGGVNDIAGAVHGKEFVFSAPAVRNIGVDNLAFAHNMAKKGKGTTGGGGGSAGLGSPRIQLVELVASDRALLTSIRDNIGVTIPGVAIQQATNAGNKASARRGSA